MQEPQLGADVMESHHVRCVALFEAIADGRVIASVPDHFSIKVANAALKYQRRRTQ